jgi:hypothetical protein
MLRDLLTQKSGKKTVTGFRYPRACRFRKYQSFFPKRAFFKHYERLCVYGGDLRGDLRGDLGGVVGCRPVLSR